MKRGLITVGVGALASAWLVALLALLRVSPVLETSLCTEQRFRRELPFWEMPAPLLVCAWLLALLILLWAGIWCAELAGDTRNRWRRFLVTLAGSQVLALGTGLWAQAALDTVLPLSPMQGPLYFALAGLVPLGIVLTRVRRTGTAVAGLLVPFEFGLLSVQAPFTPHWLGMGELPRLLSGFALAGALAVLTLIALARWPFPYVLSILVFWALPLQFKQAEPSRPIYPPLEVEEPPQVVCLCGWRRFQPCYYGVPADRVGELKAFLDDPVTFPQVEWYLKNRARLDWDASSLVTLQYQNAERADFADFDNRLWRDLGKATLVSRWAPDPVWGYRSLSGCLRLDGSPLPGVRLALFGADEGRVCSGDWIAVTTTDRQGRFHFSGVFGTYCLAARLSGVRVKNPRGALFLDWEAPTDLGGIELESL